MESSPWKLSCAASGNAHPRSGPQRRYLSRVSRRDRSLLMIKRVLRKSISESSLRKRRATTLNSGHFELHVADGRLGADRHLPALAAPVELEAPGLGSGVKHWDHRNEKPQSNQRAGALLGTSKYAPGSTPFDHHFPIGRGANAGSGSRNPRHEGGPIRGPVAPAASDSACRAR